MLLCLTVLAACGSTPPAQTTDNNFTVPTYAGATEVTALENDANFVKQVTVSDPSTGPEQVKTYASTDSLTNIKTYYTTQMPTLGWVDRSSSIIDPNALGTDAVALGFEKAGTNPTANHVAGIFVFASGSKALAPYGNDVPAGKNIILILTGSSASGTPGASTTPTPTSK